MASTMPHLSDSFHRMTTPLQLDFIACNQKLKELNINNTIRLPQICVVGDQSAGKSSLIHALSGIDLPRAAGRCTTSPIQINISSDGPDDTSPWKCTISLVNQYDYNAQTPKRKRGNYKKDFGPWVERSEADQEHFVTTQNKDELRELIHCAQRALLNPEDDSRSYLPNNEEETGESTAAEFSPNIVKLDISQGGLPTMSFIDLPGVIANAKGSIEESKSLVSFIRNLVTKYVSNEDSINLLTIPMTTDIATCQSMAIIREQNAEDRTIAVLTKPDCVPDEASRRSYVELLTEEREIGDSEAELKYGYFIVMLDRPEQMSEKEAIESESSFFAKPSWKSLEKGTESRLGVPRLWKRLEEILREQTRARLPQTQKDIAKRREEVENALKSCPPPPEQSAQIQIVHRLSSKFEDQMKMAFQGGMAKFQLISDWDEKSKEFRRKVKAAKPHWEPSSQTERSNLQKAEETILGHEIISSEDETRTKAEKLSTRHTFSLEGIQKLNQLHGRAGMPGQKFPAAVFEMQKLAVVGWSRLAEDFLRMTSDLVREHVQRNFTEIFKRYQKYPLYQIFLEHVMQTLQEVLDKQFELQFTTVSTEKTVPFTLDADLLTRKSKIIRTELEAVRSDFRLKLAKAEHEAAQAGEDQRAKKKEKFTITKDDLSNDEFMTAIEMLADTKAYYQVASNRFVDNVCQSICANLFKTCETFIAEELVKSLVIDQECVSNLFKESEASRLKRESLNREHGKLLIAHTLVEQVFKDSMKDHIVGESGSEIETENAVEMVEINAAGTTPARNSSAGSEKETPDSRRKRRSPGIALTISSDDDSTPRKKKMKAERA